MTKKVVYANLNNELDGVMSQLENSDLDIDQARLLYTRGLELIKEIQNYLENTKNIIHKLEIKKLIIK